MNRDILEYAPRLWGGPDAPPLAGIFAADEAARRAARRYWITDSLLGVADMALHHAMRLGTVDSCSWVGAQIGRLTAPRNHPDWHARADEAVKRLRPDLDDAARADLLARRWANVGRTMTEFSVLPRLETPERVRIDGAERLAEARAAGRPVICAAMHLGNWELIGTTMMMLNEPCMGVYQPPRSRFRHYLAVHARARANYPLVPPGRFGAMPAVRALREGKVLFLGVDEYVGGRVNGPLFGRPVEMRGNIANAVRFARLTNALVMPSWVERHDGARFTVHFEPPVPLGDLDGSAEAQLEGVTRLNAAMETIIRANLHTWLMLHELRWDR